MTVNGRGVVKATPDIALVTMGVITEDKNLKTAQEANSVIATNVLMELKAHGINQKDIQTLDYNIEEQYDYVDGKQIFRAYRVKNSFRVTTLDIKRMGEVIDSAVAKGVNSVNGISFQVSNPDKYYNVALVKALKQAVNKAEAIKNSSRILLNSIPINITEESSNYLPVYESTLIKSTTTPVNPGEIQISASVKAVFHYTQY